MMCVELSVRKLYYEKCIFQSKSHAHPSHPPTVHEESEALICLLLSQISTKLDYYVTYLHYLSSNLC